MLYTLPEESRIAMPGKRHQCKSGMKYTFIVPTTQCIVDGHAHIENGACAPLPLLWDKSWLIRGKSREQIDKTSTKGIKGTLFSLLKGDAGTVQVLSTYEIGNRLIKDNGVALGTNSLIGKSNFYRSAIVDSKDRDFFSIIIIQMMDMEYAHIAGLTGQTIYHEDESPWYYYERQSGTVEEHKGEKVLLPGENQKIFVKWEKQVSETTEAVKSNPLSLFPIYFYAPQRWNSPKKTPFDRKRICGAWDYPFEKIATKNKEGLFLGFKMYTPLGSQPLDQRLSYLHDTTLDGDCFYARCERDGIPIMVHCSPGGMTTHEIRYFMEHDAGKRLSPNYQNANSTSSTDAVEVSVDTEEMAIRHFY